MGMMNGATTEPAVIVRCHRCPTLYLDSNSFLTSGNQLDSQIELDCHFAIKVGTEKLENLQRLVI